MNNILLVGHEDVSRAGYNMKSAAQEMSRTANNLESALLNNQRFLDDWLQRFSDIMMVKNDN